jgi:uncharacterized protein
MKIREFNPARLDLTKLAQAATAMSGEFDVASRDRLAQVQDSSGAPDARRVSWTARAELRNQRGGAKQTWLNLEIRTALVMQCQRCLEPVDVAVDIAPWFRIVADEATAAALDAELEDVDVLAADGPLDLLTLIEDEILLSLPAVPMHETCPRTVPMTYVAVPDGSAAALPGVFDPTTGAIAAPGDAPPEHPFAALAALKLVPRKN